MSEKFDLIIVGAGIIGAACAAECAGAGMRTLVLDRGPVAGATTSAGMGHIVVMDDSEALLALTSFSRRLWQEISETLPADVEYNQCGTLWVAENDEQLAEVHRKHGACSSRGIRAEILTSEGISKIEPNLRPNLAGGLLVPDDAVVDAPAAARFFLKHAMIKGATLRTPVQVKMVLDDGTVFLADGPQLQASHVVNAAGPWSLDLTPGAPVRRRKGHLIITRERPYFVRHQVVELGYAAGAQSDGDSVACNLQPRVNGEIIIGASRQFGSESLEVEPAILERMHRRATDFFPTLAELRGYRSRAGFRAATPDKLPLIGRTTDGGRVWLATGHEGLGITTAPATGRLLAQLLQGSKTEIPTAPYDPNRFTTRTVNTN